MKRWVSRIPAPVIRERAHSYTLILLLVFAGTIAGTRLFLELTGFPRIGGGGLHIAHVLWGGLLLFAACLILLIIANRWALMFGSILGGTGMGFFMDEVGKFITETNDYFFPAAAPIIYAFFLLTLLLYLQIRKPRIRDSRTELYRVLDQLSELLDSNLQEKELLEAHDRLQTVIDNEQDPALRQLAEALLSYLNSPVIMLAPGSKNGFDRFMESVECWRRSWLTNRRLRWLLISSLVLMALASTLNLLRLSFSSIRPEQLEALLLQLIENKPVTGLTSLNFFLVQVGVQATSGLLLLAAAVLLILRKDRKAHFPAFYGLLVNLTIGNILLFYFEQFSSIILASLQFLLLLAVLDFRERVSHNHSDQQLPDLIDNNC